MPTTTKSAIRYPVLSDTANVPRDIGNTAADIDGRIVTICTSATRPSGGAAVAGHVIFETDTKVTRIYDGTSWLVLSYDPVTTWVAPTLTNSWVNYETTPTVHHPVGYRITGTEVSIRGMTKNGTAGAAMFTLPIGSRPTFTDRFICEASGGTVSISVNADGTVKTEVYSSGASNTFVSLAGIKVSLL